VFARLIDVIDCNSLIVISVKLPNLFSMRLFDATDNQVDAGHHDRHDESTEKNVEASGDIVESERRLHFLDLV
jgi:hypothetical protein